MANIFEEVGNKLKNNPVIIWIFAASLGMLVIGANHFIEDTLSSYYGLQQLENVFGIVPASYTFTYWTMSLAPQVAQIVFMYMYLTDTGKNKWAFWFAALAFFVDFMADVWYRSGQGLFDTPGKFFISLIITFTYFTIGSEGFITIGIGLVLQLFPSFITQFKRTTGSILDALFGPGPQHQPQQNNQNQGQQKNGNNNNQKPPLPQPKANFDRDERLKGLQINPPMEKRKFG